MGFGRGGVSIQFKVVPDKVVSRHNMGRDLAYRGEAVASFCGGLWRFGPRVVIIVRRIE